MSMVRLVVVSMPGESFRLSSCGQFKESLSSPFGGWWGRRSVGVWYGKMFRPVGPGVEGFDPHIVGSDIGGFTKS